MKKIAIYIFSLVCLLQFSSCSDFLNTFPKDSLNTATVWQTEADVERFLVGCYAGNELFHGESFFYLDCASDIGFSFHNDGGGWRVIGDGSMNAANTGSGRFYNFRHIRRVNYLLANIDRVEFRDQAVKNDIIAQARFIRAYQYFNMNWWYGGAPLILDLPNNAEDAQRPRESEERMKQFVFDEVDLALEGIRLTPAADGRVARGAVLMLKMRSALYYEDWQRALSAAREIVSLGQYRLLDDFSTVFSYAGRDSEEIILSVQKVTPGANEWFITIPNNADGGWSSMVPTQNLVDMFEMANGLPITDPVSGYDPEFPFYGRDPRLAATILVPGMDWVSGYNNIINTLDATLPNGAANTNFVTFANNSSRTGLTWAKFFLPYSQYQTGPGGAFVWDPTQTEYIIYRYAEALLSLAEASNELNGPTPEAYDAIDQIRLRAGMPVVDRAQHATQATFRELIRRERTIELAGEGHRRADILRWKDASGRMLAETVMNGPLTRINGTVSHDPAVDQFRRARVTGTPVLIENRVFRPHNRYLPFSTGNLDRNPQLKQNPGYL
ncbi:MAG: RagB/SusD family nutrient uptake outer membrane protein [Dysgonamonadaceae bacterium]|jgi:hypothetical protein|nr:RagB/SusD family nutrient uptake outer membrane protein [Dysgonamonadaceae bacterium]